MRIAIVIPAAGASARMGGRDKLLEKVSGVALLRRVAERALDTGWPVVVALDPARADRAAALDGLDLTRVLVSRAENGMAASLRDAMGAVPEDAEGVMILPADMPDLTTDDLETLANAAAHAPDQVWRGAAETGAPGHPVVFPARLFDHLRQLPDGDGARSALEGEEIRLCPLPGQHALTDLDTPEDWEGWRARHERAE